MLNGLEIDVVGLLVIQNYLGFLCGTSIIPGRPYCEEHSNLAYTKREKVNIMYYETRN